MNVFRFRLPADALKCGDSYATAADLMAKWRLELTRSTWGLSERNLLIEIPFNDQILELCPGETAADAVLRIARV